MTADEVARYLDRPRTMTVATIGPGGFPHQVAVWFVMDGTSPCFWTYRRSQKVRNIERDARISCLVEDGTDHDSLRGVQVAGTAEVSVDPTVLERTWRLLTEKYRGPITTEDLAGFERQVAKRCVVSVDVVRTTSWDHRRLRPAP